MNYRKSYYLLWASFLVGILLMYLYVGVGHLVIAYLGAICMLTGIGQMIKFYRCPYCGTLLRLRGGIPKKCEACGEDLTGGKK